MQGAIPRKGLSAPSRNPVRHRKDAEDRHGLVAAIDGEGDDGTVSVVRNAQPRHDVIACGAA